MWDIANDSQVSAFFVDGYAYFSTDKTIFIINRQKWVYSTVTGQPLTGAAFPGSLYLSSGTIAASQKLVTSPIAPPANDPSIGLFDLHTGKLLRALLMPANPESFRFFFTRDGDRLIGYFKDYQDKKIIRIWKLQEQ